MPRFRRRSQRRNYLSPRKALPSSLPSLVPVRVQTHKLLQARRLLLQVLRRPRLRKILALVRPRLLPVMGVIQLSLRELRVRTSRCRNSNLMAIVELRVLWQEEEVAPLVRWEAQLLYVLTVPVRILPTDPRHRREWLTGRRIISVKRKMARHRRSRRNEGHRRP